MTLTIESDLHEVYDGRMEVTHQVIMPGKVSVCVSVYVCTCTAISVKTVKCLTIKVRTFLYSEDILASPFQMAF